MIITNYFFRIFWNLRNDKNCNLVCINWCLRDCEFSLINWWTPFSRHEYLTSQWQPWFIKKKSIFASYQTLTMKIYQTHDKISTCLSLQQQYNIQYNKFFKRKKKDTPNLKVWSNDTSFVDENWWHDDMSLMQVARKLAMVEADLERAEERAEAGES